MNTESSDADMNRNPNGTAASDSNRRSRAVAGDFARQAKKALAEFPSRLDEEIRKNPYKTLAMACALGLGAGVLLSSRILRSVLGSAVSYAVVEMARTFLRENMASSDPRGGSAYAEGRSTHGVA
jgi:ElaB/YqjD/DUF883 family membrane-anchored ribosome-binding protein